jgi:hypothetical protein
LVYGDCGGYGGSGGLLLVSDIYDSVVVMIIGG